MSENGQTAAEWLDQLDASHQPERDGRCVVDVEPMPCDVRRLVAALRVAWEYGGRFGNIELRYLIAAALTDGTPR